MEWNGGMENGMEQWMCMNVANLWNLLFQCFYRPLISQQSLYEQVHCHLPALFLVWSWYRGQKMELPLLRRLANLRSKGSSIFLKPTLPYMRAMLSILLLKLWGLGVTKDRGAQTKIEAKRLRIEHWFLLSGLSMNTSSNCSLAKPDSCFSCKTTITKNLMMDTLQKIGCFNHRVVTLVAWHIRG